MPGMSLAITVEFTADDYNIYEDFIKIHCEVLSTLDLLIPENRTLFARHWYIMSFYYWYFSSGWPQLSYTPTRLSCSGTAKVSQNYRLPKYTRL